MLDGGSSGLLIVITGASHVVNGSRGTGLPARVQKKLTKKTQAVVLLNPERQRIRKEGNVPEADFLWYSAARVCNRNCFDRAEVARVMDAAGRRRDALPQVAFSPTLSTILSELSFNWKIHRDKKADTVICCHHFRAAASISLTHVTLMLYHFVIEQDIQAGLERGLVDPEVLQSFFELDQHPIIAELTRRFQVCLASNFINHHFERSTHCQ